MTNKWRTLIACSAGTSAGGESVRTTRGSALLAVLWLAAALSAIAFSVANNVRSETDRTGNTSEGLRAHYVATGGVDRAIAYMLWNQLGHRGPDGKPKWEPGMPLLWMQFPSGTARVEVIAEWAKLNANQIGAPELLRLLLNLGVEPGRAEELTAAIIDWRTPAPGGFGPFEQHYLSIAPTFRARHASLEEIEELLLVKGMTPELFHGGWARDAQGRLVPKPGLKDCLSVYGSTGAVDVNYAAAPVLATVGVSPAVIPALIERRHASPFQNPQQLGEFMQAAGPGGGRLAIGGGKVFTIRSMAALRRPDGGHSDLRRTASAMVKLNDWGVTPPFEVLRWYE
jgi:general secretion pathway protein K